MIQKKLHVTFFVYSSMYRKISSLKPKQKTVIGLLLGDLFKITSQQGPDIRLCCSRGFQEKINHIQIFQELLPHCYHLLIQLLLHLMDQLIVVRTILNITGISQTINMGLWGALKCVFMA